MDVMAMVLVAMVEWVGRREGGGSGWCGGRVDAGARPLALLLVMVLAAMAWG